MLFQENKRDSCLLRTTVSIKKLSFFAVTIITSEIIIDFHVLLSQHLS